MKKSVVRPEGASIELVRRDILAYLRENGLATQEQLLQAISWPSVLVSFTIGVLVREGLVRSKMKDRELVLLDGQGASDPLTQAVPESA